MSEAIEAVVHAGALSGAINALRKRAKALRKKAAIGLVMEGEPPTIRRVTSEASAALAIADDWDQIADAIEVEGLR